MSNKRECFKCNELIDNKEKYVLIATYKNNKTNEEMFFHFKCFKKYWANAVNDKVKQVVKPIKFINRFFN